MVNNIPLEKKNLKTIRKNVGYVFQDADSQLFMSTVFDDVALHREITECLRQKLMRKQWKR